MKFSSACLFVLLLTVSLFAQEKPLGIGVMLGNPSGITANYFLDDNNSISGCIGYSFFDDDGKFSFNIEFLKQNFDYPYNHIVPVYYGIGLRIMAKNHKPGETGFRGIVGGRYLLKQFSIETFLEAAPVINFFPETELDFDMSIGIRYYF